MNIITAVVQIGNSDDKLTQKEWHCFYFLIKNVIDRLSSQIHFSGCSSSEAPWQNACFIFELSENIKNELIEKLQDIRKESKQDSIAIMFGDTRFI